MKNKKLEDLSMDFLKEEWGHIINACHNEYFIKNMKGYMAIEKYAEHEHTYDIIVIYNLTPYIAYDIACTENEKVHKDIDEIYNKYPLCQKLRKSPAADTWVTKMVPMQYLDKFYKAICLLELIAQIPFPESETENLWKVAKNKKQLQNPHFAISVYRTTKHDVTVDNSLYDTLVSDIAKIVIKANKKMWKQYKNDTQFDACEFLYKTSVEERNKLKPACKYAVLAFLSDVMKDANIRMYGTNSNIAAIQICMNYAIEDFAVQVSAEKNIYATTDTQKDVVSNILNSKCRNAFSQLFVSYCEHVEKYMPADVDIKTYVEKARSAYDSIYENYNEEIFNNYLIGATYIQILLENLQQHQELYKQLIDTADEANVALANAENKLRKVTEQEKSIKAQAESFETEKEKLQAIIAEQQRENERLEKVLLNTQEHEKKLRSEVNSLRKQLEDVTKEHIVSDVEDETDKTAETSLGELNVCFIGGHPNFTKKIREKFGKWKFISEKQSNFPLNAFDGCDIIFQAESHCNHSLSERRNKAIGNANIPIVYLNNVTNLDMCIKKMVQACLEKGLLC